MPDTGDAQKHAIDESGGNDVKREQAVERLRQWAARAQHEAQYADTREDILHWQGQAQVLGGAATFLAGPGATLDDDTVWKQIVSDRSGALAAWEQAQEGGEAMLYAGMVAGYDIVVTALTDIAGRAWSVDALAKVWVNR
jgi:hypothetical protein